MIIKFIKKLKLSTQRDKELHFLGGIVFGAITQIFIPDLFISMWIGIAISFGIEFVQMFMRNRKIEFLDGAATFVGHFIGASFIIGFVI